MIMKVPHVLFFSVGTSFLTEPIYPVGLAYVVGSLEKNKIKSSIIDLNVTKLNELPKRLKEIAPDYVGVSIRNIDQRLLKLMPSTNLIHHYEHIIKIIKDNFKGVLILGGAGYSIYAEPLFRRFSPDYGVIGAGEESFLKIIIASEKKQDVTTIPGIVYKDSNGQVIVNRQRVNDVPVNPIYNEQLLKYYRGRSAIGLQTKRGCPASCIYCTYPYLEGKVVRFHSLEGIVNTLECLVANGVKDVFFTDAVFNSCSFFNNQLATAIIARNISIRWSAFFSPIGLSYDELALYKRAGLTKAMFGTDSLSDSTLKTYGKNFYVQDILKASILCSQLNIPCGHSLIVGGPGETHASFKETMLVVKKMKYAELYFSLGMRIYPKTSLYRQALHEGVIKEQDPLLNPWFYMSPHIQREKIIQALRWAPRNCNFVYPDVFLLGRTLWQKFFLKGPT